MTYYWLVVGDKGSHGGCVLSGSTGDDIQGDDIATIGSAVFCPKHGAQHIIAFADHSQIMSNGQPVALDGARTGCGEQLFARKQRLVYSLMATDAVRGAGSVSITDAAPGISPVAEYMEQFRAIDEATGVPVAEQCYRIELADGTVLTGVTDSEGLTQRVLTPDPQRVMLTWLYGPVAVVNDECEIAAEEC
ncbi:PAAR domain-containing protein [Stenotrophomonas humi]